MVGVGSEEVVWQAAVVQSCVPRTCLLRMYVACVEGGVVRVGYIIVFIFCVCSYSNKCLLCPFEVVTLVIGVIVPGGPIDVTPRSDRPISVLCQLMDGPRPLQQFGGSPCFACLSDILSAHAVTSAALAPQLRYSTPVYAPCVAVDAYRTHGSVGFGGRLRLCPTYVRRALRFGKYANRAEAERPNTLLTLAVCALCVFATYPAA